MTKIKPIFRIFDYDKALEFYVNWLGFKIDWEHQPEKAPKYLQISLGDIALHLTEHHGDCSPGARSFIEDFEGIENYHKELIDKQYKFNKPNLEEATRNSEILTMQVVDPFGNRLTFNGK